MMRVPDRPTIPPGFDVAKYAKESDARITAVPATELPPDEPPTRKNPSSKVRLASSRGAAAGVDGSGVVRSFAGRADDEAWACSVKGRGRLVRRVSESDLMRLPLDNRAGFLLGMMDGSLDLEALVVISSMPRDEVLAIVRHLVDMGVVGFE